VNTERRILTAFIITFPVVIDVASPYKATVGFAGAGNVVTILLCDVKSGFTVCQRVPGNNYLHHQKDQ